jgi:CRISPR/Cas system CSM-associated protein Csm2 small subunit
MERPTDNTGTVNATDSPDKIQWHPAFYAATCLELKDNIEDLQFEREYNLSKEPIRIDLLILKPGAGAIKNEIGHIMRKYNIIEYKSPDDGISIDDFFKTIGYTCLYKGYGSKVNAIPEEELTVSVFRAAYPREMIKELKRKGHEIEEKYPGIYYVKNVIFPAQIVVTSRLNPETHSSLRILTKNAKIEDIRRFLEQTKDLKEPGEKDNVDAVLQASVAANDDVYKDVRRDSIMCEALRELMQDVIDEEVDTAVSETTDKAKLEDIRNIMEELKYTADQAMDLLKIPQQKRPTYLSRL